MENIGFIIALVIAIPVILFPAAFIWYINIGGLVQAWKQREARVAQEAKVTTGI
jgi:hypothetical protein